ncbi:hypothetical protein SEVIR_8G092100v4 [Setaria viridis]|uniref:Uncharacterized protein n=1 Tax=Setaria viridis TaxID=4556 RepID=A0A4U6TH67_SETVI|nr:hypothetical protein SEVIR_8G092100v2 [Setaria viridis]
MLSKKQFDFQLQRKYLRNDKQWFFDLLNRCNEVQRVAVTVTCWHIWEARNETRNSKITVCPNSQGDNQEIQAYVDMIVLHCLKLSHHSSRCVQFLNIFRNGLHRRLVGFASMWMQSSLLHQVQQLLSLCETIWADV